MPGPRKLTTLSQWLRVPLEDLVDAGEGSAALRAAGEPLHKWHAGLGYDDRELFDIYLQAASPSGAWHARSSWPSARAHAAGEEPRKG